jgi:hypothetical protein
MKQSSSTQKNFLHKNLPVKDGKVSAAMNNRDERIRRLLLLIQNCEIFQIKLCETNVQNATRGGKKKTEDVIPSVLT